MGEDIYGQLLKRDATETERQVRAGKSNQTSLISTQIKFSASSPRKVRQERGAWKYDVAKA